MRYIKTPIKVGPTMAFKLSEEESDPFEGIEILDCEGDEAAIIPTDTINYSAEMAEAVVRAINAYDALVEACERAVEARDSHPHPWPVDIQIAGNHAEAALALVRGEEEE